MSAWFTNNAPPLTDDETRLRQIDVALARAREWERTEAARKSEQERQRRERETHLQYERETELQRQRAERLQAEIEMGETKLANMRAELATVEAKRSQVPGEEWLPCGTGKWVEHPLPASAIWRVALVLDPLYQEAHAAVGVEARVLFIISRGSRWTHKKLRLAGHPCPATSGSVSTTRN